MLSLGEFAIDGYEDHPNYNMAFAFFIFATFFTQIVFLNMLIAIMGNTFDSVMEKRHQYAQETKLGIMSDYYAVFNSQRGRTLDLNIYMFIVRPMEDEEGGDNGDSEAWEGSLNYIKKSLQNKMLAIEKNLSE